MSTGFTGRNRGKKDNVRERLRSARKPLAIYAVVCLIVGLGVSAAFFASVFDRFPDGVSASYHHLCPPVQGNEGQISLGANTSCDIQFGDLLVMYLVVASAVFVLLLMAFPLFVAIRQAIRWFR